MHEKTLAACDFFHGPCVMVMNSSPTTQEHGKTKTAKKRQMCRQTLEDCILQGSAYSAAQVAPGSASGAPSSASQMKPQAAWSSEALSRQLEPDFSHAGHTVAADGTNRDRHPCRHTNGLPQANCETNGSDTPYANGRYRAMPAQHQRPTKQAGQHLRFCLSRLKNNCRCAAQDLADVGDGFAQACAVVLELTHRKSQYVAEAILPEQRLHQRAMMGSSTADSFAVYMTNMHFQRLALWKKHRTKQYCYCRLRLYCLSVVSETMCDCTHVVSDRRGAKRRMQAFLLMMRMHDRVLCYKSRQCNVYVIYEKI